MKLHSRRAALAALAGLASAPRIALAAEPPALKIVFPFSAGGSADAAVRLFAEQLRQKLARPVIVDNRAGAGGRLGARAVKDAPPDGETLLFASASQVALQPHLFRDLGYEPFRDFAPISQVATVDLAMAISAAVPVDSVAELVDWIKGDPVRAVYGSPGVGTAPHFLCAEFGRQTGLSLRHTPYRGTPSALPDLISGRLPIYMAFVSELLEHHRDARLRIIATASATRSIFLPQVRTFKESGIDIEAAGWFAFYGPANTPPVTIRSLSEDIAAIARDPVIRARMRAMAFEPTGISSMQLTQLQTADSERWGAIVKASGIRLDS